MLCTAFYAMHAKENLYQKDRNFHVKPVFLESLYLTGIREKKIILRVHTVFKNLNKDRKPEDSFNSTQEKKHYLTAL